jgi:hypothetical protein
MNFRDFVEQTRDAIQSVAFGLRGERDVTPMLHLESRSGVTIVPIDPEFFENSTNVELLALHYVLPLIAENRTRKLAWTFCAWASPAGRATHGPAAEGTSPRPSSHPERREILLATFIDPEVIEHWAARIVRTGGPVMIGPWRSSVRASVDGGPLLTTIQRALR